MAFFADKCYQASPIWLQQAMIASWGLGWYLRRFGPAFHRHVKGFREREAWTMEQHRAYQTERLAKVLDAAWQAPYYRQVFEEVGVQREMKPWDALSRMPLLEKDILRERPEQLLSQSQLPRGTKIFKSSGSTGTPTWNYYPPDYLTFQMSVAEARNLNIAGATHRDRRIMIGGRKVCRFEQDRPPFWRYSPVERLAYMSAYHLSPRFLPAYLEFMRHFQPTVVMGYASSLEIVARYALTHDDLPAPAKCVVPVAETVIPSAREVMESAWQCQVFDRYGSVEGCVFVGQCQYGRYHISPEVGYVELLDRQGQPCQSGDMGELICTGLQNTLQPLIRYRIGDMARWATEQKCQCGNATPILEAIEGRFEDLCVTPDGREILRFHAVFYGLPNIKQAQVVQEKLDFFVVRVVPGDRFGPEDIEKVKANMRLHVGNVQVRVDAVPEFERTANGKVRAVVCKLSAEERRLAYQKVACT